MQQITQDYLANKAKELLNSGICNRVFGWKRGEFDYDLTPAVFNQEVGKPAVLVDVREGILGVEIASLLSTEGVGE